MTGGSSATAARTSPACSSGPRKNGFVKLEDNTAMDVDAWRDTWTFREGSYSQRVHGAAIKRFFTWAVTFDLLERNPFDKLDPLELKPVPTLPLSPEEVDRLVGAASQCTNGETLATLILLMRWSGLAIRDASCLRRDALLADNSIKTRRQKTNEYVYVKIPADVAERLRAVGSINPAYFFWNGRTTAKDNATVWGNRIRAAFDRAGITPRGSHRLRDTCGCEFLNAGGLMQDLSKLLGHSSIKTTEQHYAPWDMRRQEHLNGVMDENLAAQEAARMERAAAATTTAIQ
ncbi:MAG: tyrosine-type recombinase/integrase [Candidatus Sulfotelmatobacter sp.]